LLRKVVKRVIALFAVVLLFILKLLQPFFQVQLCIVGFHRYGHLALEPEVFISEKALVKKEKKFQRPLLSLWSFGPKSRRSNVYLSNKWKNVLCSVPSWFIDALHSAGAVFPLLALKVPELSVRGNLNGLDKTDSHLSFTSEEIALGDKSLTEIGINPNQPYVCLIVRDGGHYASKGDVENSGYELLNFDIDTFVPSVKYLVNEGFQVIRMGSGNEKPIAETIDGVIDYAKSHSRSEFLDVYIAATCEFAVSTQTGPDAVCMLFRRPVLYVDVTRYSQFFFGMKCATWTPARLFKNEKLLSLSEIASSDIAWFKEPTEFLLNGVVQQKSSPNELLQIVQSYVESMNGVRSLTGHNSRIVAQGMGARGRVQFGEATALSVPDLDKILGEWVNN